MKLYALLSKQGTACIETTLTEQDYLDLTKRKQVNDMARLDKSFDPPIPDTWTDVSENAACQVWSALS